MGYQVERIVLDCPLSVLYNDAEHLNERREGAVGTNPMKAAAEWFYNTVFKAEAIRPGAPRSAERLPALLRAARSLENGSHQNWQSRESIFLKQGKLLAGYEDDYDYRGSVRQYYPTYQALSDQELRGYFTWRTKLRKGDVQKTSLSFAFLYIYELINQIGAADPMDGYRRLESFRDVYGQIDGGILPYLERWLTDYVIYYGLDSALLGASGRLARDRQISILDHIRETEPAQAIEAVDLLSRGYLGRSRFYGSHREDMDRVVLRVLERMSAHYAARCKKTLAEQYFGVCRWSQIRPFDSAVFCDPLRRRSYEYAVDGRCIYRCEKGLWSAWRRSPPPGPNNALGAVLKTIDSMMREAYGDRHPVKAPVETKWIVRIIDEEIQSLLAEKKAAGEKKVSIDYAQLTRIRQDAAITREKLIVEEEMEEPETPEEAAPPEPEQMQLFPARSQTPPWICPSPLPNTGFCSACCTAGIPAGYRQKDICCPYWWTASMKSCMTHSWTPCWTTRRS